MNDTTQPPQHGGTPTPRTDVVAIRGTSAAFPRASYFVDADFARTLERELLELQERNGQQLAACDCAAMMDTAETHENNKTAVRGNPFWSPAFDSVMRRTAECITLRSQLTAALDEKREVEKQLAEMRSKADECWGAANYRLKYIGCLFRAAGLSDHAPMESRISEAAEHIRTRLALAEGLAEVLEFVLAPESHRMGAGYIKARDALRRWAESRTEGTRSEFALSHASERGEDVTDQPPSEPASRAVPITAETVVPFRQPCQNPGCPNIIVDSGHEVCNTCGHRVADDTAQITAPTSRPTARERQ